MTALKTLEELPNIVLSSDGIVQNVKTGHIYKHIVKRNGYCHVTINNREYLLHRLIAKAFCAGYEPSKEVNHKDGNKQNNNACNLEWVDRDTNLRHAFLSGLSPYDTSSKGVIATSIETGERRRFSSIYKAAHTLGISQGNICLCCQGKRPYANGYYWNYEKGE